MKHRPDDSDGRNNVSLMNIICTQWLQMVGVLLMTVFVLEATLLLFTNYHGTELLWPARQTNVLLLCGLSIILLVLTGYQFGRIRYLITLHRDVSERSLETSIANRLMSLRKLTKFVGANADLQKILDHITETGLETFRCEQVSIMLLNAQTNELEVLSAAGLINSNILGSRQKVGFGVAGKVAKTAQPVILGSEVDPRSFVDFKNRAKEISASMVVPILLRDELIGVLCVSSRKTGIVYNSNDLQILQVFSEIVAVCIRHAQQAGWMRRTITNLEAELRKSNGGRVDAA